MSMQCSVGKDICHSHARHHKQVSGTIYHTAAFKPTSDRIKLKEIEFQNANSCIYKARSTAVFTPGKEIYFQVIIKTLK